MKQDTMIMILGFIKEMDVLELRSLNQRVVGEINERYSMERRERMRLFSIGDRVGFTHSKTGRHITGVVKTINRKTITLTNCSDGLGYRVSPSLLKKVDENPQSEEPPKRKRRTRNEG